jgi:hypothetical protein
MYRETVECAACNARKASDAMARRKHWGVVVGVVTFGAVIYGMSAFVWARPDAVPVPDAGRKLGTFMPTPAPMDPDPLHWSARDPRFACSPQYSQSSQRTEALCWLSGEPVDSFAMTYGLLQRCEVAMDPEVHGHFTWWERKEIGDCPKTPPPRILWALGALGHPDATVENR